MTLGQEQTRNIAQYPLHHMTYALGKFEVATSNCLGGDAFLRKHIISLGLDLKSRTNTKRCPVSYDLCTCKVWSCYVQRFRRKYIYKKYLIWPWPDEALPSTSCDLCTCKVWSCYSQWLRRCITKKIHYLTLTPRLRGSRSHKMLPSTLDIMWPMHKQSLILPHPIVKEKMLLRPMVKEKMHLQEYTLFDLIWSRSHKCCPVPSTSCDLCTSNVWYCYIP